MNMMVKISVKDSDKADVRLSYHNTDNKCYREIGRKLEHDIPT